MKTFCFSRVQIESLDHDHDDEKLQRMKICCWQKISLHIFVALLLREQKLEINNPRIS